MRPDGNGPTYYTDLATWAPFFKWGCPVLTYHKLGPVPRGVRLKGLYLSEKLFEHQLAELAAAGYVSGTLECATNVKPRAKEIIITFDDGFQSVIERALQPLERHQFRAVQFLVAGKLGGINEWDVAVGEKPESLMDAAAVRDWLAAGHAIGSHTLTHPRLTQLSQSAAREEIFASRKRLEDEFAIAVPHFCYPFGDWNERVRDLVMEAGYQTACTTIPGVNTARTNPFEIERFTARYASRNWKWLRDRFRRVFLPRSQN